MLASESHRADLGWRGLERVRHRSGDVVVDRLLGHYGSVLAARRLALLGTAA